MSVLQQILVKRCSHTFSSTSSTSLFSRIFHSLLFCFLLVSFLKPRVSEPIKNIIQNSILIINMAFYFARRSIFSNQALLISKHSKSGMSFQSAAASSLVDVKVDDKNGKLLFNYLLN